MIGNFIKSVGKGVMKTVGALKEPLRRIGQVGYAVGKYAIDNHATLAPLIHGVAVMSGNTQAQRITGGIMALSKTASLRQNLNADNNKIASKGGYGVYDHGTNKFM